MDAIRATLEKTPPELSADIIDHGIMLTGGGALLRGLDRLIAVETKMPVHVAENPLDCVVDGTGMCLESDVLGITGTREITTESLGPLGLTRKAGRDFYAAFLSQQAF